MQSVVEITVGGRCDVMLLWTLFSSDRVRWKERTYLLAHLWSACQKCDFSSTPLEIIFLYQAITWVFAALLTLQIDPKLCADDFPFRITGHPIAARKTDSDTTKFDGSISIAVTIQPMWLLVAAKLLLNVNVSHASVCKPLPQKRCVKLHWIFINV